MSLNKTLNVRLDTVYNTILDFQFTILMTVQQVIIFLFILQLT